jgi:membrane-associated phospholipid phosphatase
MAIAASSSSRLQARTPRSIQWPALVREVVLILAAVGVYFGIRGQMVANPKPAFAHAHEVINLEQWLGIDVEHAIQTFFLRWDIATDLMNWMYIWGHWPVIGVVLIWLFLEHPKGYRIVRDAMLVSGAFGIIIFAVFPVAPPRLVQGSLVDTVTEFSRAYRILQPPIFTNPYAAMPSLHVGWDFLIGMAIVFNARWTPVRIIGALLPILMTVAVLATANHYVLDVIAGISLALASLSVVGALHRYRRRAQRSHPKLGATETEDPVTC